MIEHSIVLYTMLALHLTHFISPVCTHNIACLGFSCVMPSLILLSFFWHKHSIAVDALLYICSVDTGSTSCSHSQSHALLGNLCPLMSYKPTASPLRESRTMCIYTPLREVLLPRIIDRQSTGVGWTAVESRVIVYALLHHVETFDFDWSIMSQSGVL